MSYTRWGGSGDWYIFGMGVPSDIPEHQVLSVHHSSQDSPQCFLYPEVCEMVRRADYSGVTGVTDENRQLLVECLERWIADVPRRY